MLTNYIEQFEANSRSPECKSSDKIMTEDSIQLQENIKFLNKKLFLSENIKHSRLKNNRKSKSCLKGRDYLCSICWKSYLSYSAMYVHLKAKHKATIFQIKASYSKYFNNISQKK